MTLVLVNSPRVDGTMTNGQPLTPPLERVAVASSMPNRDRTSSSYGMTLLSDASVVYFDWEGQQVVRVLPDGQVLQQRSPGRPGGGAAQGFWNPTAYTVDAQGNAYVADGWFVDPSYCLPGACFGKHNPMGPGAWGGVWKITPSGEQTRLTGVVAGDAFPNGPVDGDKDTARFDAITSMVASRDGNLYVADRQRVDRSVPLFNPPLEQYIWKEAVLRRIEPDGRVTTVRADELPDDLRGGKYSIGRAGTFRLRNSVDADGNTWVMSAFTMYTRATEPPDPLHLFAVTRHGADGAMLPGSLLYHWGCQMDVNQPSLSTCLLGQLGLAQGKLYGVVNGDLIRVDLQALLPK